MEQEYNNLLNNIISIVESEQDDIDKYYDIGKNIKENQKKFKEIYLIDILSKDLQLKFGKGFSIANLSHMQNFYKSFKYNKSEYLLAKQLGWRKIIQFLPLKDSKQIKFYIEKSFANNWDTEEIKQAIEEELYEEYLDSVEKLDYDIEIESVEIINYKSIIEGKITTPKRFSVFVGANASGKSNIFEAFEFLIHTMRIEGNSAVEIFGGTENIKNYNRQNEKLDIKITLADKTIFGINYFDNKLNRSFSVSEILNERFYNSFSRIFFEKSKKGENKLKIYNKLWFDGSNLPKILKRILEDENKKSIITTKLKTFIPELDRIEVKQNDLTGQNDLQVYFKNYEKQPFVGNLISEGTYNIIAILTLIYQSDEPQFLCIEEPENGLHPRVIKLLINFFRTVCENKKHYIWITSHSQTLVSEIMPEEIILVDKQNGKTIINQFQNDTTLIQQYKNKEITMDEAWLCNYLENWTTNEEE